MIALLLFVSALLGADGTLPSASLPIAAAVLPACEREESSWCVWNAETAGLANGGASYIDIAGTALYFN